MASHWNYTGQVDGYSQKNFAVFFLPTLLSVMLIILKILPKIDPYKHNFSQYQKYYDSFVIVICGFLSYTYYLTLFWNLNFNFNFSQFLAPGFAILFFYAGLLTSNARQNWFVGIRTPWTMTDEVVWKKTHQFGGKAFTISAFLSLLGFFMPNYAIQLVLGPVLVSTLLVFIYSFLLYHRRHSF
jgi:uncharacterized membrane protein